MPRRFISRPHWLTITVLCALHWTQPNSAHAGVIYERIEISHEVRAHVWPFPNPTGLGQTDVDQAGTGWIPIGDGGTFAPRDVVASADYESARSVASLQSTATLQGQFGSFRFQGEHSMSFSGPGLGLVYELGWGSRNPPPPLFTLEFQLDSPTTVSLAAVVNRLDGLDRNFGAPGMEAWVDGTLLIRGGSLPTPEDPAIQSWVMSPLDFPAVTSVQLEPGIHVLDVQTSVGLSTTASDNQDLSWLDGSFDVALLAAFGGGSELDPLLPGSEAAPWTFNNAFSGRWYDPALTDGYTFEMLSDSLFTGITSLPSFLEDPVTVRADEVVVGTFGAGEMVDFTGFSGGGVSKFSITGINPLIDGDDPRAIPIQLAFNSPLADFSMTPIAAQQAVPEPGSMALLGTGLLSLIGFRCRRQVAEAKALRVPPSAGGSHPTTVN